MQLTFLHCGNQEVMFFVLSFKMYKFIFYSPNKLGSLFSIQCLTQDFACVILFNEAMSEECKC